LLNRKKNIRLEKYGRKHLKMDYAFYCYMYMFVAMWKLTGHTGPLWVILIFKLCGRK
jgi:hypothetical protein